MVDDFREARNWYNGERIPRSLIICVLLPLLPCMSSGSTTVSVSTAILIVLAISAAIGALLFAGYGFLFVDGVKYVGLSCQELGLILPFIIRGRQAQLQLRLGGTVPPPSPDDGQGAGGAGGGSAHVRQGGGGGEKARDEEEPQEVMGHAFAIAVHNDDVVRLQV